MRIYTKIKWGVVVEKKLRIEKLKSYDKDEGLTLDEEEKFLEEKSMRRLTPDEMLDNCQGKEYDEFMPCRLKTPGGLLVRGGGWLVGGDYRRGVYADVLPGGRLGVLGVKKDAPKAPSK